MFLLGNNKLLQFITEKRYESENIAKIICFLLNSHLRMLTIE